MLRIAPTSLLKKSSRKTTITDRNMQQKMKPLWF